MIAARLALGLAATLVVAAPAHAAQVVSLSPTDAITVADRSQLTGRRVSLPLPDCKTEPSTCDELRLLNELDGASVNPRVAIRFSGPIAVSTVTRDSAFLVPLSPEPLPSPIALMQLVWDAATSTLHARPERELLQARRYATVVTSRVTDEAGRRLRTRRVSVPTEVARALAALGLARQDVAAAEVFTTQSVTTGLERMRDVIAGVPASEMRFTLEPDGGRSVYPRDAVTGLQLRRQVATTGQPLANPTPVPIEDVPPSEVGTIAFGTFRSTSFLSADRHIPRWLTQAGAPRITGFEDVAVTVFLPAGTTPAQGWPVAIFGHGFGNDRLVVTPVIAGGLARHGIATVAINVVGHGGGPAGTLTVMRSGRDPVVLPSGGRGVDLDGDGKITPIEGVSTRNDGPLALIGTRDGLRQTVVDLMQLVRAIRRGVDVDGDGRVDLDRERIFYVGQSFGGMYGTLLMAVEPLLPVGVLNVPGGPVMEIARLAPQFRPAAIEQLGRRRPSLLNGEREFVESIPLPGDPPMLRPARGALPIQAYLDRAEWLTQPANPAAFAPYLRSVPLEGLAPKAVLYQMAIGDRTVPNPTTENIVRTGDLRAFTSVYRHDLIVATLPERFRNPHAFLSLTGLPAVGPIARAAQDQVARFFLSGGREIAATSPYFDLPGRGR